MKSAMTTTRELMTLEEAANYLSYSGRSGALRWLRAKDVEMCWRGRRLLVRKADIDAALSSNATGNRVARAKALRRVG